MLNTKSVSHRYVPRYTSVDARYRADACRPLIEATARGEIEMCALARGHYPGRQLPRGQLMGLKSVGFWDASSDQSWGLDWHRNEGLELTFCESGELSFAVDTSDYKLYAMDLTITRPWQLHRLGIPAVAASRLHWVILDVGVRRPDQSWHWPSWIVLAPADLEELTDRLRRNEYPVWPGKTLRGCFSQMSETLMQEPLERSLSAVAVGINQLLLLVLQLLREQQQPSDRGPSDSRRVVHLFLQDLASNPGAFAFDWTVANMAESCGLGKTQFVQHCRQLTNLSPSRYLQQCRLAAAAKQLREHVNQKITDVALRNGFSSSQYFATKFREQFGCSPGEYQKHVPKSIPASG